MALRTVLSLLAAVTLLSSVQAREETSTQLSCRTEFGVNKKWMQVISKTTSTSTVPSTLTVTRVFTTTAETEITPSVRSTETKTETDTLLHTLTLPEPPDTFTTTSYSTQYIASNFSTTPTKSVTTTNTSTVYLGTSTIGTPAGFTPIAASGSASPEKRGIGHIQFINQAGIGNEASIGGRVLLNSKAQPVYSPILYPSALSCNVVLATVTTTEMPINATTTITKTKGKNAKPSQTWVTETSTSTITTHNGAASKTHTVRATTTVIDTKTFANTTTLTSTTFVTLSVPISTSSYAACAPNNLLSQPSGAPIVEVEYPNDLTSLISAASAYDCCVACHQSHNCGGSFFLDGYGCGIVTLSTCDGSQDFGNGFKTGRLDTTKFEHGWYGNFTVSNGPCGQLRNVGWVGGH